MAGYQDSLNDRFQAWCMLGWILRAQWYPSDRKVMQFLPVYLQPIILHRQLP